jgi:hypothetical protein
MVVCPSRGIHFLINESPTTLTYLFSLLSLTSHHIDNRRHMKTQVFPLWSYLIDVLDRQYIGAQNLIRSDHVRTWIMWELDTNTIKQDWNSEKEKARTRGQMFEHIHVLWPLMLRFSIDYCIAYLEQGQVLKINPDQILAFQPHHPCMSRIH